MPQFQHTMAVAGCEVALLSVLYGNGKWEVYEIASDWMYQEDLLEAELRFWHCVQSGEPPAISIISHAPKPIGVREVCMTGHNAWAAFAADWLEHRDAAKTMPRPLPRSRSWSRTTSPAPTRSRRSAARRLR